jgi:isoleucyl-tRNA synthetase
MTHNVLEDGSFRADLPLFGGQHILTPEGKEGPANVSVIKQAGLCRRAASPRAS